MIDWTLRTEPRLKATLRQVASAARPPRLLGSVHTECGLLEVSVVFCSRRAPERMRYCRREKPRLVVCLFYDSLTSASERAKPVNCWHVSCYFVSQIDDGACICARATVTGSAVEPSLEVLLKASWRMPCFWSFILSGKNGCSGMPELYCLYFIEDACSGGGYQVAVAV